MKNTMRNRKLKNKWYKKGQISEHHREHIIKQQQQKFKIKTKELDSKIPQKLLA